MMHFSLVILFVIIAALGGLFVWWQYNRFDGAIQAILYHGGSVSYDPQKVGISFAPWMPTMRDSPDVKSFAAIDEKVEDLFAIYDDVRYLACQRPLLRVEFSDEKQAQAMQQHFTQYPVDECRVELTMLSPHHAMLVFRRNDISLAESLSGLPFFAKRTKETTERDKPARHRACLVIPLPISPMERFDRFEGPICDLFDKDDGGDVIGSGTFGNQDALTGCDITIEVIQLSTINRIVDILRQGGAPPDTLIQFLDQQPEEVNDVRLEDWVDII